MDFTWLSSPTTTKRTSDSALRMHREEVRRRAALLHRLGRSQAEAERRCRDNVAWEYDVHDRAQVAAEVAALVAEVYRRGPASVDTEPRP